MVDFGNFPLMIARLELIYPRNLIVQDQAAHLCE
jgi:hypothetical protein